LIKLLLLRNDKKNNHSFVGTILDTISYFISQNNIEGILSNRESVVLSLAQECTYLFQTFYYLCVTIIVSGNQFKII